MKKGLLIILSIFMFITNVKALDIDPNLEAETEEITATKVTLVNCQSATTAWVNINGVKKRIRLIAFDPSVDNTTSVDEYVCNILTNAKNLEIEYDVDKTDKYNRELVWLYVDGNLLQEKLIKEGYGQVNYITNAYKYLDNLCELQKNALTNKLGIWNNTETKEAYCNSGVEREEQEKEEKEEETEEKKIDTKELKHVVFLSSLIFLILIVLVYVRKNGKQ